jgi:hypothetical protein
MRCGTVRCGAVRLVVDEEALSMSVKILGGRSEYSILNIDLVHSP